MGTLNLNGMRARRLELKMRARGVRDVKVAFDPAAEGCTKDELMGHVCAILETYLDGEPVVPSER
jgi:hypothetical protein